MEQLHWCSVTIESDTGHVLRTFGRSIVELHQGSLRVHESGADEPVYYSRACAVSITCLAAEFVASGGIVAIPVRVKCVF